MKRQTIVPTFVLSCIFVLFSMFSSFAAEHFVEPLWPGGAPLAKNADVETPDLTIYLPDSAKANGAAVIIFPGGGYWNLAMDHEGHQVAQWLNSFGVAGIIVRYRRGPGCEHPVPLTDAKRALRTARFRANEWNIDPNRIGSLGFSAGGHLASTTGVHFDDGDAAADNPIERVSSRPDFVILVYPVISMTEEYTHKGSKRNLLGENPDSELAEKMSSELQVTAETPPTFLILSDEDKVVPAENSVAFYLALRDAGVPAEMHIFETGKHGFGLDPLNAIRSDWMDLCQQWMWQRGYLGTCGR